MDSIFSYTAVLGIRVSRSPAFPQGNPVQGFASESYQLRVVIIDNSDDDVFFAVRIEPRDLIRNLAVPHDAIRCLNESEIVHLREAGERRDESDVRTFRRLDRAHAAVLRIVHVADFEAGALTGQATRSEG